jgi:hypothetical protein
MNVLIALGMIAISWMMYDTNEQLHARHDAAVTRDIIFHIHPEA